MNKINEIFDYGLLAEFAYVTLESEYYKKGAGIDEKTKEFGYDNSRVIDYLNATEKQIEELYDDKDLIKKQENRDFWDNFKVNYEDTYEYKGTSKQRVNILLNLLNKYEIIDFTSDDKVKTFKDPILNGSATDFQAILLKDGSKYIIAFRGTASLKDAFVDINIANLFKNNNEQYNVAIEFIENMKTKYSFTNSDLTLIGHSLGGILSQCIGANLHIKSFAYNPLGTSSLAQKIKGEKEIHEKLINNNDYEWLHNNILTISYIDGGMINGDVLSNIATSLNTSRHIGIKIDFFGKNVGLSGHSIITLNKLLEEQSQNNLTTLEDIKSFNKKQKTLFFDIVKQRNIDILYSGGLDQKLTISIQSANDIFTNKNLKDMLKNLNDEKIHSITMNANISEIEDKKTFNNKVYYNPTKKKLKVKVKDFFKSNEIIKPFIIHNDKLKKHNIIIQLQGE